MAHFAMSCRCSQYLLLEKKKMGDIDAAMLSHSKTSSTLAWLK